MKRKYQDREDDDQARAEKAQIERLKRNADIAQHPFVTATCLECLHHAQVRVPADRSYRLKCSACGSARILASSPHARGMTELERWSRQRIGKAPAVKGKYK